MKASPKEKWPHVMEPDPEKCDQAGWRGCSGAAPANDQQCISTAALGWMPSTWLSGQGSRLDVGEVDFLPTLKVT